MFGPIARTSFKRDEAQLICIHNMVTWAGMGLRMGITLRSCKGHFKVTTRSDQPKSVKIVSFCSNCVHLGCLV